MTRNQVYGIIGRLFAGGLVLGTTLELLFSIGEKTPPSTITWKHVVEWLLIGTVLVFSGWLVGREDS